MHAGQPMVVVMASRNHEASGWKIGATLLDGSISGSGSARQVDPGTHGTASFAVGASQLFTDYGTLQITAGYSDTLASLYGSFTAPIGSQAVGNAKGGTILRLPISIAGSLYLHLQGGTDESFTSLGYAAALDNGWQTADNIAITDVNGPLGVRASTSWTYVAGPGNSLGADVNLVYTPSDGGLTGRAAARYAAGFGPATVSVSGGWDLGQGTVGIGSALSWDGGPWSLQVNGDAGLDTVTDALSFGFGLTGHVAVDVDVPEAIVGATGGRKLGTIEGLVHAGSKGLPNVTVRVGPYRVRTDRDGRFRVQLPPGKVHLQLQLVSLPIQYQVEDTLDRDVTLVERQTSHIDFPVVASSGLTGSVLLDNDGNGTADTPPRSGGGTVLLTAGAGSPRALPVDASGTFVARGLLPGTATLQLSNLPLGSKVEGAGTQTITLRAGTVSHATFLVEPAVVSAPVFRASSFRVRSIETEIAKVPPGAAPLVTVKVQGHADSVNVVVNGAEHPLTGDGDTWTGRVPVPLDAKNGMLRYQVVARASGGTSRRDAQLLVVPSADAASAKAIGPGRPGGGQKVIVTVYLKANGVELASPFGDQVEASETQPGRWTALLPIPSGTTPDIYSARYAVTTQDGRDAPWTGASSESSPPDLKLRAQRLGCATYVAVKS